MILIMTISLNMAVIDHTETELPFYAIALLTFAAAAAASAAVLFPVSLVVLLVPLLGAAGYLYYTDAALLSGYIQKSLDFLNWLYGYAAGYNYFKPDYSTAFVIVYAAFAAFVVSLLVYSRKGSFALIVLGTAAMAFFWFIYVEKARIYLMLYLFAAILLYTYRIYKKRLKEWRSAGCSIEANIGRNWMLCSAAVVSASIMLSLVLPLNIKAVSWPWLNEKVVNAFPFIAEWRNDAMESFSYGFNSRYSLNLSDSRDRKLGGEVLQNEAVMLTVRVRGDDLLYLRGVVKDKYSENSWSKSGKAYKEYRPGDDIPLPFGSSVATYEKSLEITHDKLLTSTIFAPYSVYRVQHRNKSIYADEDSEVYTSKLIMRNEPYTVISKIPYIDPDKLRHAKAEKLGAIEAKLYTSLDPAISQRVISLAQTITSGKDNAFDKAKAIEGYLRKNYKYTLKPKALPSGAEFTDHFLFEGKEGYCTYFATAMAVMLRASGVPCRYVEGFLAKPEGEAVRLVRGTDAHAWVEVYFDEYGWVAFEPTPQYPVVELRQAPDTAADSEAAVGEDAATDNTRANILDRRRHLEKEEEIGGDIYVEADKKRIALGAYVPPALLILLLARLSFMYAARMLRELSLRRSQGRNFAAAYIMDLLWYLRRAGYEMNQGETLREFLAKVGKINMEGFSDNSNIVEALEKISYSLLELSSGERKQLEMFRKSVKQLALNRAGALQLFISLYLIGK